MAFEMHPLLVGPNNNGSKNMYSINRSIAVIKPKQPLLDWVESLPEPNNAPLSENEKDNDCLCYLIPEFDFASESMDYVRKLFRSIFDEALEFWCPKKDLWPEDRSPKAFEEWFKVEIHSHIVDLDDDDIEKEEIPI